MVTKLRNTLLVVMGEDTKEQARATAHDYTPFLLRGEDGSSTSRAMQAILTRCNNALTQRGN